jgi:metallophosphoesterase superfamily enzyme
MQSWSGLRYVLLISCAFLLLPAVSSLPVNNTVTYSFIHLSDPQSLTTNYPETLNLTFSHIESLKNTYNISAIIITGDLVNSWDNTKEWETYIHARNLTTIPVYEIAGNHDTGGEIITNIIPHIPASPRDGIIRQGSFTT